MKKFINRAPDVVEEMVQGLLVLYPGCARVPGHKVLIRADAASVRDRQVAVISGGGSGHEPAHAGYVGAGMLSAAVAGEIFTSPSTDSVFAAIQAVAGKPGSLLVVKNYTGDRLNFGLAAEMARAEGIPVALLMVDDDVALRGTAAGARGLAGTVFVHKLIGAAAAEGKTLAELTAIGKAVVQSLATMGVSFSAGTSPAVGKPSFELDEQQMELGLGIHGEPGVARLPIEPADTLTETLLGHILQNREFPATVAVMINNLGATTAMELAIVARHAVKVLEGKGIEVARIYAGTFLSSLDMAGISISVLGLNQEWLRWLDAPTAAPAWPNSLHLPPGKPQSQIETVIGTNPAQSGGDGAPPVKRAIKRGIKAACQALILAEPELTELDRITGDGDLGAGMARAARAVEEAVNSYPLNHIPATLKALAHTLGRELGGSSGPLYGIFFLRCATVLEASRAIGPEQWAQALERGCQAISELGGARPGDRTMLDALDPFARQLKQNQTAVLAAVEAAEQGAAATAQMKPKLGRSSYLGDRVLGYPDPGAKAVCIWLRAVCELLFPNR